MKGIALTVSPPRACPPLQHTITIPTWQYTVYSTTYLHNSLFLRCQSKEAGIRTLVALDDQGGELSTQPTLTNSISLYSVDAMVHQHYHSHVHHVTVTCSLYITPRACMASWISPCLLYIWVYKVGTPLRRSSQVIKKYYLWFWETRLNLFQIIVSYKCKIIWTFSYVINKNLELPLNWLHDRFVHFFQVYCVFPGISMILELYLM